MISGDRSILEGKKGAFWYTLQEMRKHWDRIDIICPRATHADGESSRTELLQDDTHEGGDVFFHPCPQSLLFQSKWIVACGTSLITQHAHNVMTVHDYPPFYNGIGAKALHARTGIPYVTEIHHIVGWPKAASISEWIGRQLSRLYLARNTKFSSAVRVVNSFTEKQLTAWGVPSQKIQNISSMYLDGSVLGLHHKPPVAYDISFCSRLVANKGLGQLLDAVALLTDARLLIIGEGPERNAMEKKAKDLGIENRVTFLGWLPTQEAVSGAIQTARIFVMNSTSEGGPRVALEAMGCGMPVIVTPVGMMPDLINDGVNGIFTTGDAQDLAKKIGLLLQNDVQRESMGKEAMKILERFERSMLIQNYADFLKSQA